MEQTIFYWTGFIIWWCVCVSVAAGAVSLLVVTPLMVYRKSKRTWWTWFTLARFKELGWTQEELKAVADRVGGIDEAFLRTAQRVMMEDVSPNTSSELYRCKSCDVPAYEGDICMRCHEEA